jgi:hypothetical protein
LKADVLAKSFEPNPIFFYRARTMLRMQRGKSGRFASLGLLTVLVVLPGFALWGAVATYQSGVTVTRAIGLSNSYEQARFAVGEEESLERKYRLNPDVEVRTRHSKAGIVVAEALHRAAKADTPANIAIIDEVLAQHEQYFLAINRMFAAVDASDTAAAEAIDSSQIDPRFDKMQALVVAAATRGVLVRSVARQLFLAIASQV